MRIISSEARAALASGRFRLRCLLRCDLDDGVFAVWDDVGTIEVDEVVYHGAAGRFKVSPAPSVSDLSARSLSVVFSGLDQDVANFMDGGGWHQRPVTVTRAIIAEDAPQVLHLVPIFAGFLDQLVRRDAQTSTLEFCCESAARELSRRGVRTRNDADQRQRDPDDAFFSFAAAAGHQPLHWGRQPLNQVPAQQKRKKLFGIF